MATPSPDAVSTFMRITGSTEFVAVQKLEEYGGHLNEAVNAYFVEGQRQNLVAAPQYEYSDVNNQNRAGSRGILPFLSAARRFRPSLLLDPNYRRELRDTVNGITAPTPTNHAPHTPHPGEAREVPSGFNNAFEMPHYQSGLSSTNANRNGNLISDGRGVYGTENYENDYNLDQSSTSHFLDNEIEEAMIQAAIEASKKDGGEGSSRKQFGALNSSSDSGLPQNNIQQEDDDLAHALSLSKKMAEQEEAIREQQKKEGHRRHELLAKGENTNTSKSISEWEGISYDELSEAVLIESALFGEIPTHSSHKISSLPGPPHHPEKAVDPKIQSLSSAASQLSIDTQLLRQQQDAEYLESLFADKQKELNSLKEAETRSLKEEESQKKMLERKELDKMLAEKNVKLSNEPPSDDKNAITIVVRMPDGSRRERRFLKTDKLRLLFDFIDISGVVKPGTYRVVKSYPRRAYGTNDSSSTLNEVGLSSKNEALFLELI
ncbi:PREDICTED: plant UBX domain-containing protein 13-like isoform X2 [Lupinus angustifolius]|uniref:plant UBX domain-containing protein 13-like isoform X2 n=1 Tax=Lupinus angustifolius TaxID=3871 RepID=UPI00092ECF48|nr:PREDICTED: plant UBX domain-containing protein 13-like isoform X2 [Lupinus angustifolius]